MEKFNIICRTCNMERSNLVNLTSFAPGSDTLKLRDILYLVCPSLPTEMNERLPQQICYFCSKQLEIAYKFQLQCKKSHDEQWELIESTIKRSTSPEIECVKDEDAQSEELNKSCAEDEFEDSLPVVTENMEFLEEEEIEATEDMVATVDETTEKPVDTNLETYPESDNPKICCHCNKTFHSYKGLRLHEKLTHKNLKPILVQAEILTIVCKCCSEVFEKRSDLFLHYRLKHAQEMEDNLTCSICQKEFTEKTRLKHHLLYHGEKRFVCTVEGCNRLFPIKYKLTDHLRRFHGITLSIDETKALRPSEDVQS